MQLVGPLAAGVRGAKNGSATILVRGSDEAALVYLDANGGRRLVGSVALDVFGSCHCYVDEAVDVTVLDADGDAVRSFTVGSTAGVVEARSDSFTGRNYDSGAAAVGEPVQLDALLARLLTSAGAIDFQVAIGSQDLTIKGAVAAFFGSSVRVTSAKYGAVGNGVVDDQVPIQQAIDEVFAAGGGAVYLPPGNYAVGGPLRLRNGVSLLGEGSSVSRVTALNDTNAVAVLTGAKSQRISGIALYAASASTSALMDVGRAAARIEDCYFDGTNVTGNIIDFAVPDVSTVVERCTFNLVSTNLLAINAFASAKACVDLVECSFLIGDGYASSVVSVTGVRAEACLFDWSDDTSGTFSCFQLVGDIYGWVDACEFIGATGPTVTLVNIGNLNSTREFLFEDCSMFEQGISPTMYTVANTGTGYYARMKTVDARCAPLSTIATVGGAGNVHFIVPDASQYGVFSVRNDDNTAGATASGCCFGATTTSENKSTVAPWGARRTAVYAMKNAEDFTKNENLSRNSVMPAWKSIAASAHAMKLVMMRGYGYSPAVGMTMRWHACGVGGGEPTVDTAFREAYAF